DYALNTSGGSTTNTVTVTNPGGQVGTVGTAVSLQIAASDSASGQTLTYSATGLPPGLSINSSTGLISGTPTTAGTSSVTVTVKDSTGATGTTTFSWTVNAATGNTITVTNPGNQSGTVGAAVSLQIHATDSASGQALTYTATGLPAGLSINGSTGLISGTPTTAGTSSVSVFVTDPTRAKGSATFTWTINAAANTVTVTNPGSQTSTAGTAISALQIQATDSASGQTLTYGATGLPAGLTISSSGQITGTPTTAGTSSVTVTATDGTGAKGTATFSWTVNPAAGGCTAAQLLKDPGFESGTSQTAWSWTSTLGTAADIFNSASSEPPHSGTYDAWLNGWGQTDTDTLAQAVSIPSTCKSATLAFWLHIDTAETSTTTNYDTLKVQILNGSGTVLSTLHTYGNLDHNTGYAQHSFDLSPYIGKTITLKFIGSEDYTLQTSFVLDDTAINVS
ncbi:MAG: putative Ig domain-containing protein, partial [Solirubrobacterales bacterium]|nr:putative Ig domain-containing protein [Solirubrobacterales bacterium]